MQAALLALPDTHSRCSALFNLIDLSDDDEAQQWARDTVSMVVDKAHTQPLGGNDGHSLVYIAQRFLGSEHVAKM